ncbi:hypothetical protein DRP77_13485 [Candidatus Poribacteria bacterium]|nr:MAG: hypothetical protein DRP77_13485 [Candidatus Poribacteria bacterium]
MRFKAWPALAAILLAAFIGCGEEEKETIEAGGYKGFMELKGGEWAEYTVSGDGMTFDQRVEFIGTDTWEGKECYVIEMEMKGLVEMVYQVWVDKSTHEQVMAVAKQGDLVMRIDLSSLPKNAETFAESSTGTPSEYQPGGEIRTETYQTPTGKTVEAVVFAKDNGEAWVSGEVPFGIVKIIADGQTVMELKDFGLSGAQRDITKEEAENAISIPMPGIGG